MKEVVVVYVISVIIHLNNAIDLHACQKKD